MGTDRCPILELNQARTGIGTVFHVYGTMALDQPQRGEDNQHWHQQSTIKKHWNSGAPSAFGSWKWRGGAAADEGGAVRIRQFIDVATLRGQWHRINPSEARTISIDTDKQQPAS